MKSHQLSLFLNCKNLEQALWLQPWNKHRQIVVTLKVSFISVFVLGETEVQHTLIFTSILSKRNVLRSQCSDTNRNIKRLVYCRYG